MPSSANRRRREGELLLRRVERWVVLLDPLQAVAAVGWCAFQYAGPIRPYGAEGGGTLIDEPAGR